jgi:Enoyl-(Acyl carrier protein) reductase
MTDLTVWVRELPPALAELPGYVAATLGVALNMSSELSGLGAATGPLLVLLTGADLERPEVFRTLDGVIDGRTQPTALVIGDGWIGTEVADVGAALVGAGAVALARSISVRRHATGRVNVVCVPEGLVGAAGSQRGPLALEIASADVADVVAFVLSDQSSYIDGQVLYADGGRQLFSSLTA